MELVEPLWIRVPAVLSSESLGGLESALGRAEEQGDAAAWGLVGGPGVFCKGMDFASLVTAEDPLPGLRRYAAILARLRAARRPTIAVVDGEAVGGGVGLAAACDWVVATPRSTFSLPEALFGLLPGVVLPVLLERMSAQKARLLSLVGGSHGATWAARHGLVDDVALEEELVAVTRRVARSLSRVSAARVRGLRSWADEAGGLPVLEALWKGAALTAALVGEPSVRDGLALFVSQGSPPWEAP